MTRTDRMRTFCALGAVAMLTTHCFSAAPPSADASPPPDTQGAVQPVTIAARVESLNLNEQRGTLDGLILVNNGQRVQVNLPESIVDAVAKAVAAGDVVQATVVLESGPDGPGRGGRGAEGRGNAPDNGRGPQEQTPDHPVYRAQSIRDAHGQLYTDAGNDSGPGGAEQTVSDSVKALNYDHRGELNGLQLSKGDFVRLPREAAGSISVKQGDQVSVEGPSQPITGSKGKVIDARSINGTAIRGGRGGPPDGPGGPPDGGAEGRGGAPPPPPDGGPGGGRGGPDNAADDLPGPEADPGPPPPDIDDGPNMIPSPPEGPMTDSPEDTPQPSDAPDGDDPEQADPQ